MEILLTDETLCYAWIFNQIFKEENCLGETREQLRVVNANEAFNALSFLIDGNFSSFSLSFF